jgi:hypothetical protein
MLGPVLISNVVDIFLQLAQARKAYPLITKIQPKPVRVEGSKYKMTDSDQFQIRNRNGVWQVNKNGLFYGDYFREEQAIEAVRVAQENRLFSRPCGRI